MAYEVLARKWRPQLFDDVVGQEHVTATLTNAINSNRIAHAYIFTGPRGIGKTSLARIFARALNCAKGPTATPCGTCDSCVEIAAGNSLDVLEIDGASNNGVEHIRELRENVKYTPTSGKFKIYIIDEVHMLSQGAFNALLKTLEEPPAHVKFIFATTEVQKVLPTILSRCQRYDLRRIPVVKITERLKLIANSEKVKIDEDALLAIARGADGGLRDAESALDQLIAFCGKSITEQDVLSVFGLVARQHLESLAEAVIKGDIPGVLTIVAGMDEGGKDLQRLLVELLEHFRNLLVIMCVGDAGARMIDSTEGQLAACRRQAELTDIERALRIVDILTQTEDRIKFALSRRTLVETALIRCARAATVVGIDELIKRVAELGSMNGETPVPVPAVAIPAASSPGIQENKSAKVSPSPEPPVPAVTKDELASMRGRWPEIIEKVARFDAMARGALTGVQPVAVTPSEVTLAYDPGFVDEARRLETSRTMVALQNVLGTELQRKVQVRFRPVTPPTPQAEYAAPAPRASKIPGKKKTAADVMQDSNVKSVMDLFNATVTEIRDTP